MINGNINKEQWRAEDAIAGNAEDLMSSQRTHRLPSPLLSSSPKARSQMDSGFASLRPSQHRKEESKMFVSQLFTLLDSAKMSSASVPQVVVVASTNRAEAIDPALRRSGRFDVEIEVTTPAEEERFQILKLYTRKVPLDTNVDLHGIAASCNGFVGADLEALCREAAMSAIKRHPDANKDAGLFSLTIEDWKHARTVVGPSITRGVAVEIPKVTWEDKGGLNDLKKKLQQAVEWPIKYSSVSLNILLCFQGWESHPCMEFFFMVLRDARKPHLLKPLDMLPKLHFFL